MAHVKQFLAGLELDIRPTVALFAGAVACLVGALVVRARAVDGHLDAGKKIQRARKLRDGSLEKAEQAVLHYKNLHPKMDSSFIVSLSLAELTSKLQDGLLKPEDLFYSYMEKAIEVNKKLNCCTSILLESFEHLKTLDPNDRGLLYGVPVSIKENMAYKNYDSSCGVVVNLGRPAERDSVIVQVLKRQGAIPFVKTNISQSMLSYECSNVIYGPTVNPHNLQKTSGGSSGGEAALIGGGGSILGIGSDLGGSVRIPAAFCGICGFKPTVGRLSKLGTKALCPGQKSVSTTAGPLAKDVDSLALCMQALLCDHMFALDPTVPPVPFNVQMYKSAKPLRIGYMESDGFTQPTPSMTRSLREVRALLEQAGHTLVPYNPLRIKDNFELATKGVFADGGANLLQKLKGGPLDPSLKLQVYPFYLPCWLRKTLSFLMRPLSPRGSFLMQASTGVGSVSELWQQHSAVEDYIHETLAEWRRCNIDVLLCPMFGPAYNFFHCGRLPFPLFYTAIYNLLNFPAGVVPVSTVTAEDEEELRHYKGLFQDFWDKLFKKHPGQKSSEELLCHLVPGKLNNNCVTFVIGLVSATAGPLAKDVDSLALCMQALLCDHMFALDPTVPPVPFNAQALSGGRGLPMAVQCVARPWQDELCLRFMKEVEELVKQSRMK